MALAGPVSSEYVMIDESYVRTIPQTTGLGCAELGILTTDRQLGIRNQIPADFNPRPNTNPSPTK